MKLKHNIASLVFPKFVGYYFLNNIQVRLIAGLLDRSVFRKRYVSIGLHKSLDPKSSFIYSDLVFPLYELLYQDIIPEGGYYIDLDGDKLPNTISNVIYINLILK